LVKAENDNSKVNDKSIVFEFTGQAATRPINELNAVAIFATEILDPWFIVKVFGSLKLEG